MEVMSQRRPFQASSSLNPNAPMFVPMAYRTVEDYSDQWWSLVHSSPWFRDYWLQERFQDPQLTDSLFPDLDDPVLPDIDALFENYSAKVCEEEDRRREKNYCEELVSMAGLKWRKGRGLAEPPRYVEKASRIVSPRVSPRTIQQPR